MKPDRETFAAGSGSTGTGLGQRLVETVVRQLQARHEVTTGDGGTTHSMRIPG